MSDKKTLNHTEWECKYHVVFIPKYRRKAIYGQIQRELRSQYLVAYQSSNRSEEETFRAIRLTVDRDDVERPSAACAAGSTVQIGGVQGALQSGPPA